MSGLNKSNIPWCTRTWSPGRGCLGCELGPDCWALRTCWRMAHNPNPKVAEQFEGLVTKSEQGDHCSGCGYLDLGICRTHCPPHRRGGFSWTGTIRTYPEAFDAPFRARKPQVIFVWPHGDIAHAEAETVQRLFRVMGDAKQHQFLVLTKWPQLLLEMLCEKPGGYRCWKCIGGGYSYVLQRDRRGKLTGGSDLGNCGCKHGWRSYPFEAISFSGTGGSGWIGPFANVWVGVSATDQATYDERVSALCHPETGWPGNKWVSCEPMVGPIDGGSFLTDRLNWCIIGCASGPQRQPMEDCWAEGLVSQCLQAKIPSYYKQQEVNGRIVHGPRINGNQYLQYPPTIGRLKGA